MKNILRLFYFVTCMILGFTLYAQNGHTGAVNDISIHPDGVRFASCSDDGTIIVWDAERKQAISRFQAHNDYALCVAYSPDGTKLLSGGADYAVILRDADSGKEIRRFNGHTDYVRSVAFSPDGTIIASGGDDDLIMLWDAESGLLLDELSGHTDYVRSVAFSPDGMYLASASDDVTVVLWEIEEGRKKAVFTGHSDYVRSVSFSPDGRYLASGSDDMSVIIWDLETNRRVKQFLAHDDYVRTVFFTNNGEYLITGGDDGLVKVWDWREESVIAEHDAHDSYVFAASANDDFKYLVSAGNDAAVVVYEMGSGDVSVFTEGDGYAEAYEMPGEFISSDFHPFGEVVVMGKIDGSIAFFDAASGMLMDEIDGHTDSVWNIVFSHAGDRFISSSGDGAVQMWNFETRDEAGSFNQFEGVVWTMGFSSDDAYCIFGDASGKFYILDAETLKIEEEIQGHDDAVIGIAFSPLGDAFVTTGADGTIIEWRLPGGRKIRQFRGVNADFLSDAEYSTDGSRIIAVDSEGFITRWERQTGVMLDQISGHDGVIYDIDIVAGPGGERIITTGEDGRTLLWDAGTLNPAGEIGGSYPGSITSLAIAPSGGEILSISDNMDAVMWDLSTGDPLLRFGGGLDITEVQPEVEDGGEEVMILCVALNGENTRLAAGGSDGVTRLWDFDSGNLLAVLEGHSDYIRSVLFSPDDALLATASDDGTIRIWNVRDLALEVTLYGHTDYVRALSFSVDGEMLLSASDDGTIRFWDMETHELIKTLEGGQGYVYSLDSARDGNVFVSGGEDGTVKVWNKAGDLLRILNAEESEGTGMHRAGLQ